MKEKLQIFITSSILILLLYLTIIFGIFLFGADIQKYNYKFKDTVYIEYNEYIDNDYFGLDEPILRNHLYVYLDDDFEKQQDDETHHYVYDEISLEGEINFKVNWDKYKVKILSYEVNKIDLFYVDFKGNYDDYWDQTFIHEQYTDKTRVYSKISTRMKSLKSNSWYRMPIIPFQISILYYEYNQTTEYYSTKIIFNKKDKTISFKHLNGSIEYI